MKKIISGVLLALSLVGCATTSGLDAQTSVSDFDGTKSATIAPHSFKCESYVTCANLGFNWRDDDPDNAAVMVEIRESGSNEYYPISSAKLNIDGEFIDIKPYPTSTNNFDHSTTGSLITTKTSRLFIAPLTLLEKIKQSNNTKMQVIADGAVIEGEIKNSGDSTKAYYAMLRFLDQVNAER